MESILPKAQKTFSDRMQDFVTDPEIKMLEAKYEPYLDLHVIEFLLEVCDVVKAPLGEPVTGKLIWKTDRDLPIELKKDIIKLYRRHFINE
jgi:hypothetical protein